MTSIHQRQDYASDLSAISVAECVRTSDPMIRSPARFVATSRLWRPPPGEREGLKEVKVMASEKKDSQRHSYRGGRQEGRDREGEGKRGRDREGEGKRGRDREGEGRGGGTERGKEEGEGEG